MERPILTRFAAIAICGCFLCIDTGCSSVHPAGDATTESVSLPTVTQTDKDELSDVSNAIKYLNNGQTPPHIIPTPGERGVVVGSPIATGVDPTEVPFGDACSDWLQLELAGQPEFGTTPSLAGLVRAMTELQKSRPDYDATDAKSLGSMVGATDIVTCTMSISASQYSLSYQTVDASSGAPVGGLVTLTGTRTTILSELPGAARKLSAILGLADPKLPPSVQCSPDDMDFLGRAWYSAHLSDADLAHLASLAPHSGLAAIENLSWQPLDGISEAQSAVDIALSESADSPIVCALAAVRYPRALIKYQANLVRDTFAYPGDYLYSVSLAKMFAVVHGAQNRQLYAAIHAVTCDASNPDAWTMLSKVYSDQAESVRMAREPNEMTKQELASIQEPYAYWLGCSERAAQLDPKDVTAWSNAGEAASFCGYGSEGDAAIRHAMHLGGDPYTAYDWALQMYQPKWYSDPAKLNAAALLAASDTGMTPDEIVALSGDIDNTDNFQLHRIMVYAAIQRLQSQIAADSGDASEHESLGEAYLKVGRGFDAENEFRSAATLEPSNAVYQEKLGGALYDENKITEAMKYYEAAEALVPDYEKVHYEIGLDYKRRGDYAKALAEMSRELAYYPDSVVTYDGLGDIYAMTNQHTKAAADYLKFCVAAPWNPSEWENAADQLDDAGQYIQALQVIAQAQKYCPNSLDYFGNVQEDCYLKLKQPDMVLTQCKADLAAEREPGAIACSHENAAEAYLALHNLPAARSEWRLAANYGDQIITPIAEAFLRKYGS